MRLHKKINLVSAPFVILCLCAVGFVAYGQLRERAERRIFDEVHASLHALAWQAEALQRQAVHDAELLAASLTADGELGRAAAAVEGGSAGTAFQAIFAALQARNPEYLQGAIFHPDGRLAFQAGKGGWGGEVGQKKLAGFFERLQGSGSRSSFLLVDPTGEGGLLFFAGRKIQAAQHEVSSPGQAAGGSLVLAGDAGFLERQLATSNGSDNVLFMLAAANGMVLLPRRLPFDSSYLPDQLLEGSPTDELRPEVQIVQGSSYFFFVRRVADNLVAVRVPAEKMLQTGHRLAFMVGAATLAVILLFVFFLAFFSRRLLAEPISRLNDAVIAYGRGEDDVAIGVEADDEIGELARSFVEMRDNLRASREQICQLASQDALTGLPNRAMFVEFLKRSLARAARYDEILALFFIDLDNFKRVNDTLGHEVGDLLLQQVAERLRHTLRDSDLLATSQANEEEAHMVARLGGDEFTVVLPQLRHQNDAAIVAERQLQALLQPFHIEGHEIHATISIGITVFPFDSRKPEELIMNADVAMYHAKNRGRNTYSYYSAAMNTAALERFTLEAELRRALERREFVLYYQPQVDARTEEIVGLEALVRWRHPERGMVPPGMFIPLAEETGLIGPIGEWVLREAVGQIRQWQENGMRPVAVAVNLSSPQFEAGDLERLITSTLAEFGVPPSLLKVEITESILLRAEEKAVETLDMLKRTGVQVCLDDFGTGYSSLAYLKEFPIDVIKVDRSFVRNIATDRKDAEISSAIIALGKCLHLTVVAEGVEEKAQLDFLRDKGCDTIQGFYFYKPMPAAEAGALLPPAID